MMNKTLATLCGLGVGAGLGAGVMFVFDPVGGPRRRALARDQGVRLTHFAQGAVEDLRGRQRGLANRARGVQAQVRALRQGNTETPPDATLVARIRSELGHVVSHPHAIKVTAQHGRVTLSGPVLATEESSLIAAVWLVPGVQAVENHLEAHDSAEGVPSLQSGAAR